jgi:hypothetical protein
MPLSPFTPRACFRAFVPLVMCSAMAIAQPEPAPAPDPAAAPAAPAQQLTITETCSVDLAQPGQMWDVLSNVLTRTAGISGDAVRAFEVKTIDNVKHGDDLVRAAAKEFGIDEAKLFAEVRRWKHVNCNHGPVLGADGVTIETPPEKDVTHQPVELTKFARDVALHVVLHEIGHGLIREFGIPILGNEETMADAFATHYLVTHMPDRAFDAIMARVTSLQIEASEISRNEWPVRGEHDSDARRAYQIAALAVAADRQKYLEIARFAGLSAGDIRSAVDYGAEIHRSWRRTLAPLMMPEGMLSKEANVEWEIAENSPELASHMPLIDELRAQIKRFDWHSFVRINFVTGDGGANWNRGTRTIRVFSGYMGRFVDQGRRWELMSGKAVEPRPDAK